VITGAFGALGQDVAAAFGLQGYRLALIGRGTAVPDALERPTGGSPLVLSGVDAADPPAAETAAQATFAKFGRIDALVNIAGGFRSRRIAQGSPDDWDDMYRMNLRTALVMSQAVLPYLLQRGVGGRIINVGAMAAARASAGTGAYAASKSGVLRLTEALAEELKEAGITVNAVLPSTLDTAQNRKDMPNANFARWVQPAALARVIVFLASPDAQAITGVGIPVSGGGA
jgi:NAD(P)-dependent dehydrogenase (short-subunit alcohol dehydrogenase family)